jgi:hypothetical protein
LAGEKGIERMGRKLEYFQELLRRPIGMRSRVLLVLAVLSIPLVFSAPLWTMSFQSNQYPDPLRMSIYINHIEGQKTANRDDLREINALNHYIGMKPLMESDFSEFLWMPFVMGFFALITLRATVLGTVRDLVDIVVLFLYFSLFSGWNFYNRLYEYGHNLNPEAAIHIEPFTPPFFGRVQIANFYVESFPGGGSFGLFLFGLLILAALALSLLHSRKLHRES